MFCVRRKIGQGIKINDVEVYIKAIPRNQTVLLMVDCPKDFQVGLLSNRDEATEKGVQTYPKEQKV